MSFLCMQRQCGKNNAYLYDKILTEILTKEKMDISKTFT